MNEICESPLWGLSVERRRTEKWKIFKNFLIFHITRNKNQFGWDLLYLSCWLWSFKVTVSGTLWFPQDRWVPLYQKERLKKVSLLFPPSKMARFLARNLSLTAPEGRVLIGGDWIIPSDSRGNLTAVNPATEQPVSDLCLFSFSFFLSTYLYCWRLPRSRIVVPWQWILRFWQLARRLMKVPGEEPLGRRGQRSCWRLRKSWQRLVPSLISISLHQDGPKPLSLCLEHRIRTDWLCWSLLAAANRTRRVR